MAKKIYLNTRTLLLLLLYKRSDTHGRLALTEKRTVRSKKVKKGKERKNRLPRAMAEQNSLFSKFKVLPATRAAADAASVSACHCLVVDGPPPTQL